MNLNNFALRVKYLLLREYEEYRIKKQKKKKVNKFEKNRYIIFFAEKIKKENKNVNNFIGEYYV